MVVFQGEVRMYSENRPSSYKKEVVTGTLYDLQLDKIFAIAEAHINGRKEQFTNKILDIIRAKGMYARDIWDAERITREHRSIGQQVIGALWSLTEAIHTGTPEDAMHSH
jgi:hypothetical protein